MSSDPEFERKLCDVVGLYLDPPERAVVFSFDEKTQCQALDRTQPSLPIKAGRAKTMTHDYKRNGTLDLFAAMNVGTGEVLHHTRRRHAGADVLAFSKWIDLHVDRDLDIHVVLDNLSAHKSAPVREWLAHPKRQRWHLHFTPTSASWLNRPVGLTLERRPPTLRVDQDRRRDRHQSPTRASHPPSRHWIRDTPLAADHPEVMIEAL